MKIFCTECTGALQINAHLDKYSESKFSISSVDEIKLTSQVPTEKPLRHDQLKVALHHKKQPSKTLKSCLFFFTTISFLVAH